MQDHGVAHGFCCDTRPNRFHHADAFMPEQVWKILVGAFLPRDFAELRPANRGVLHAHQDLADAEWWDFNISHRQRGIQFRQNRRFHLNELTLPYLSST